jgi:hypothetical protein
MSNGLPILAGLDAIVNPDNVKPGIDLKELERRMIKGGIVTETVKDPAERLSEELRSAALRMGIDFGDDGGDDGGASLFSEPTQPHMQSHPYNSPQQWQQSPMRSGSNTGGNDYRVNDHTYVDTPPHRSANDDDYYSRESVEETPKFGGDLLTRTLEQERRSHINSVIGDEPVSNFSLEKEKKEDLKCMMLAEIDSLINSLRMEEVDLSRIPTVGSDSPYEVVETTLKILRHKNDQVRSCTFMEEMLMFGAYGLEELFNGQNVWFSRYTPDLTGWHNHLNVKLRRIRYDTGQFTSGLMENYKIGHGTRMMLEIVPNLFLYSRMRKQQHSQPSLFSEINDNEIDQANARIASL